MKESFDNSFFWEPSAALPDDSCAGRSAFSAYGEAGFCEDAASPRNPAAGTAASFPASPGARTAAIMFTTPSESRSTGPDRPQPSGTGGPAALSGKSGTLFSGESCAAASAPAAVSDAPCTAACESVARQACAASGAPPACEAPGPAISGDFGPDMSVARAVKRRLRELSASAGYRFTDATGARGAFLITSMVSPYGVCGLPAVILTELRTVSAERLSDRRPRLRAFLTLVSAPPGNRACEAVNGAESCGFGSPASPFPPAEAPSNRAVADMTPAGGIPPEYGCTAFPDGACPYFGCNIEHCPAVFDAAAEGLHRHALALCRDLAGTPGVEAATDFSAAVRGAPTLGGSIVLDAMFDISTY